MYSVIVGNLQPAIPSTRVHAIDWLRGLSVLLMIECHSLAFLKPSLAYTPVWNGLQNINGLVAVAFLFSSGFAAGLVGSRAAKDVAARRRRMRRTFLRIAEVLAVAMYFHLSMLPLRSRPATLLKVDILTCIAYGMIVVWAVVTAFGARRALATTVLMASAVGLLAATPWAARYRGNEVITSLLNNSDFDGWSSMFPLFPWLTYPLLGASFGVIAAHPSTGRRRLMIAAGAMAVLCLLLTHTPPAQTFWHQFNPGEGGVYWIVNALQRLWKLGLLIVALLAIERVSVLIKNRPLATVFRPLRLTLDYFSRHALTGYLVHLSLIYGFFGISFTHAWMQASDWPQYAWRTITIIALTAVVCGTGRTLREWLTSQAARVRTNKTLAPS